MTMRFDALDPGETRVLTFDASKDLAPGEVLTGDPQVTVTMDLGTDPTPNNIVLQKQLNTGSLQALVEVANMQNNCDYHITVECTTSNPQKVIVMAGVLPVRSA